MAAYRLACLSSKSPLVKLCAFWVPSEAFMSGVPAFILGCRWTLHFLQGVFEGRSTMVCSGLQNRLSLPEDHEKPQISARTCFWRDPGNFVHLRMLGSPDVCWCENWKKHMSCRELSTALHYHPGTAARERTRWETQCFSLLFTLFSAVLQDNLENRKPFFGLYVFTILFGMQSLGIYVLVLFVLCFIYHRLIFPRE